MSERPRHAKQESTLGSMYETVRQRAQRFLGRVGLSRQVAYSPRHATVEAPAQQVPDEVWAGQEHPDFEVTEPRLPHVADVKVRAGSTLTQRGWETPEDPALRSVQSLDRAHAALLDRRQGGRHRTAEPAAEPSPWSREGNPDLTVVEPPAQTRVNEGVPPGGAVFGPEGWRSHMGVRGEHTPDAEVSPAGVRVENGSRVIGARRSSGPRVGHVGEAQVPEHGVIPGVSLPGRRGLEHQEQGGDTSWAHQTTLGDLMDVDASFAAQDPNAWVNGARPSHEAMVAAVAAMEAPAHEKQQ
jgi:hypothetical protein